jgi:hypothetical protein
MTDVATNPTSPYSNFDYGQVQTSVTMPDPYMAALRYGMLEDVREQVQQRLQRGYAPQLDYRVAPISTGEQMGIQTAQQGLGAFMPFLQAGETAIQGGQNILTQQASPYLQQAFQAAGGGQELINQALGLAQAQRAVPYTYQQGAAQGIGQGTQLGTTLGLQGIGSLGGAAAMYDPRTAESFMNPYEDVAVQRALADISRQGELAQQGIGARATRFSRGLLADRAKPLRSRSFSAMFCSSRQTLPLRCARLDFRRRRSRRKQPLSKRAVGRFRAAGGFAQLTGQLGTNLGQLGLAGSQALGQLGLQYGQLGQQDVNQLTQLAQQQGALGQGIGALAGQAGTLGTQLGQLGVQQAGIGEIGQNITSSQLQNVFAAGGLERGIAQSALDAARLSNVQREAFPYQQYGFLADIYAGVPSAQSVSTGVAGTQTSPFQTAIGLGIQGLAAASGAQRAGLI